MTAAFECEIRFRVADVEAFHRRLAALGAVLREAYAFTDHYYQPRHARWDPRTQALRIREHTSPEAGSEILFTHIEITSAEGISFKRSLFAEGKIRLYAGTLADCRRIVETLGFVPWITVRKEDGRLFDIPGFGSLVTEHVEGIGWMGEVEEEGSDPHRAVARIRAKLERLGVSLGQVTGEPVAALVDAIPSSPGAKVYFCGSIRGGRDRQPLYRAIVDYLEARGFEVLTTHVAASDVLTREWREGVTARDIYERDLRWIAACDLVIAEVSTPSLGVGVEITEAQHLGKPILVLCHADVSLSAMVGGNQALAVITYRDEHELLTLLEGRLLRGALPGAGVAHER